jgi:hypothetical protein
VQSRYVFVYYTPFRHFISAVMMHLAHRLVMSPSQIVTETTLVNPEICFSWALVVDIEVQRYWCLLSGYDDAKYRPK